MEEAMGWGWGRSLLLQGRGRKRNLMGEKLVRVGKKEVGERPIDGGPTERERARGTKRGKRCEREGARHLTHGARFF